MLQQATAAMGYIIAQADRAERLGQSAKAHSVDQICQDRRCDQVTERDERIADARGAHVRNGMSESRDRSSSSTLTQAIQQLQQQMSPDDSENPQGAARES
jgi:hypothetical protein